jgi:hypothetical protein
VTLFQPPPTKAGCPVKGTQLSSYSTWSKLENGDLLSAAENAGFQIFVTTDQNLRYQQNLAKRKIAIVMLLSTSWPKIRKCTDVIKDKIDQMEVGGYVEIPI